MGEDNEELDILLRKALSAREADSNVVQRTVQALEDRRGGTRTAAIRMIQTTIGGAVCGYVGFLFARFYHELSPSLDPMIEFSGNGQLLLWGVL